MFITTEDYIQIGEEALDIIKQSAGGNSETAQERAISIVSSYLRGRYDVDKTFTAEGAQREQVLVGLVIDIALYLMAKSLPNKMGLDTRKQSYDEAISFLKDVQKGNTVLDIPTITGPDGEEDYGNPIIFDCGIRNKYDW